jgi:phosphatidylinositol 4-kinase type 2
MATHMAVVSGGGARRGGPNNPAPVVVDPDLKLFIRNVLENKKRPIQVRTWSTIKDVKDQLSQKLQVPASSLRLFFGPLLTSGKELPNHRTLHDVGIYRSGETILLDIKNHSNGGHNTSTIPSSPYYHPKHRAMMDSNNSSAADVQISSSVLPLTPKYLQALVSQARWGLMYGLKPDLVLDGSGGTYILHDVRKNPIAIFKPSDEEPYAENNPRGYLRPPPLASGSGGRGSSNPADTTPLALRDGVAPGEACIREVAAYLLDTDGFAGVPPTTLVEARHATFNTNGSRLSVSQGGASIGPHSIATTAAPSSLRLSPVSPVVSSSSPGGRALVQKPGSFQEFVKCECTIDDISPSKIAVAEVHKIAILDLRIMNADRNAANLLVRRRRDNTLELVPIDHGFCLRSVCDVSWMDWCWLDWPQLKEVRERKMAGIRPIFLPCLTRAYRLCFSFSSRCVKSTRTTLCAWTWKPTRVCYAST